MEAINVFLIVVAGVCGVKIYFEISDAIKTSKDHLFPYSKFVDWEEIWYLSFLAILCAGLAFSFFHYK